MRTMIFALTDRCNYFFKKAERSSQPLDETNISVNRRQKENINCVLCELWKSVDQEIGPHVTRNSKYSES